MTWFKIDDSFYDHPKVEDLEPSAIGIWTLSGTYCARHLTDGFVTRAKVRRFGASEEDIASLVASGLWHETEKDGKPGYQFHDWEVQNPTRDAVMEKREKERLKKQAYRRKEDGTYAGRTEESPTVSPGDTPRESSQPDPARPVPTTTRGRSQESQAEDAQFEEFWAAVPRKVGKVAAKKAWAKAVRDGAEPGVVLDAMVVYAESQKGKDPQYIAHPTTWLNRGSWEDEAPKATGPKINPNQMNW